MIREGHGSHLMTLPTGVINSYPVPAPGVSPGACRSGGRQQHAQGDEVLPQGTFGTDAAGGMSPSRAIRQRKAGPRDPYATGLSKRPTSKPPLAVITFCEAMLSTSVVSSTYGRPTSRNSGKSAASAAVA